MALIRQNGNVILYDTQDGNKPVKFHQIDASEALAHPSKRWTTVDPNAPAEPTQAEAAKADTLKGAAEPAPVVSDDGVRMKLKAMDFKVLRVMAKQAEIPGYIKMTAGELVEELIKAGVE